MPSEAQRKIEYLSPPAPVSMGDQWFEIASIDHFWIQRRFRVLQSLAGQMLTSSKRVAEFGCGHGLLQRQFEAALHRDVSGFDLNEIALRQNVSKTSGVFCYDIFQENGELAQAFDLILLFDVLEHISAEKDFLLALLYHLSPAGKLIINVPAGHWAFSEYDVAAGHVRRYDITTLRSAASQAGLRVTKWTYWGLPLMPALVARKALLALQRNKENIISSGFDSRSNLVNSLMATLAACEFIPQHLAGTSLMAILERA